MRSATSIPRSRRRAEPMPRNIAPMLAVLSDDLPPEPQRYAFEYKWDGVRAITYLDGRNLEIRSRNDLVITHRYPELTGLRTTLRSQRVILDGEIIALDEHERPSFLHLQRRMHVNDPRAIERLTQEVPVWYVVFDLLYVNGSVTMNQPYTDRRALLEELIDEGEHWYLSPWHAGRGHAMLDAARHHGLEGVIAKKLDSTYQPGRRSPDWLKIKIIHGQEFVIGGWVPELGEHRGRVGSLLLGYYDADGKLRYAGNVGSGFTDETHQKLTRLFGKHARPSSPFIDPVPRKNVTFLEPVLVANVEYRRWPRDGFVQQGAFKGLREDKPAREVVREVPRTPSKSVKRSR